MLKLYKSNIYAANPKYSTIQVNLFQLTRGQQPLIYIATNCNFSGMAAHTIAALDRCMAATIEYTSQRKAFGKSILDNQYVHYKLAEFQTEVRGVRSR